MAPAARMSQVHGALFPHILNASDPRNAYYDYVYCLQVCIVLLHSAPVVSEYHSLWIGPYLDLFTFPAIHIALTGTTESLSLIS